MVEVFLLIAIWLGHSQRLFAVQRIRTTMDQIVAVSEHKPYRTGANLWGHTEQEKSCHSVCKVFRCTSNRFVYHAYGV